MVLKGTKITILYSDEEYEAFYLGKAQSTILVATVAVYLHESNDILIEPYTIKFSRSGKKKQIAQSNHPIPPL